MKRYIGLLLGLLVLGLPVGAETLEVEPTSTVTVAYKITLTDDRVVAEVDEEEPSTFTLGQGKMFPTVEEKLVGMKVGESQTITLSPEEAFGPVDPEALRQVPLEQLPEEYRELGRSLSVQGQDGPPLQATVVEINEETVVLDFNHPMAGRTLNFEVRLLDVE